MNILRIQGLSISFGGIRALQNVELSVSPEEILAVIGPNGSGKTTLFNCISGVYRPNGGEISFDSNLGLGTKFKIFLPQAQIDKSLQE